MPKETRFNFGVKFSGATTSQLGQTRLGGLSHSISPKLDILACLGSELKFEAKWDQWGHWVEASKKLDEKKVYSQVEFEPTILVTWSGHFTTAPQRLRGIRTRTRFSNLASFTLMYTEFRDTTGPRLHWSHLWPWGRVHTTKDCWFAELCISPETFLITMNTIQPYTQTIR